MNRKSTTKRVLIVEPHTRGHHGPYLQWMAEGLVERGFKITLRTLPESMNHPSLQYIADSFPESVDIISSDFKDHVNRYTGGTTYLAKREFAYWRLFRKWYRQDRVTGKGADFVFLPYLDHCLYAIGLLGSPFGKTPWIGIAMRPSFHYDEMGITAPTPPLLKLKRLLFLRVIKNRYLKSLLTIDQPLVEYLENRINNFEKVNFLPEPCDLGILLDQREAKKKLGIDPCRKIVLVYGALNSRKGAGDLLRAIADSACPKVIGVVLAGKVADDIRALFKEQWVKTLQKGKRIFVIDRFITTEDERILFSAVDMVWLGYRDHYTSSGVLVQAARAGLPVIACEEGIIGWQTTRHNMGIVVQTHDTASIVSGIKQLTEHEEMCSNYGDNGQRAYNAHTIDKARQVVTNVFEN
jgi:glycosyltransferase involved in cell wall biosynthesis